MRRRRAPTWRCCARSHVIFDQVLLQYLYDANPPGTVRRTTQAQPDGRVLLRAVRPRPACLQDLTSKYPSAGIVALDTPGDFIILNEFTMRCRCVLTLSWIDRRLLAGYAYQDGHNVGTFVGKTALNSVRAEGGATWMRVASSSRMLGR